MLVRFKTKPVKYQDLSDKNFYEYIKVPRISRSHCDMGAFRQSKRFGGYANSDLFPGMINRAVAELIHKGKFRADQKPIGVTTEPGFLTTVIIDVPDK